MSEHVRDMKLTDFGESRLYHYGMHTIKGRAIPNLMDGLKPVHRRILYAMFQKGLTPTAKALKATVTIGETMGNYHPHGDQNFDDTMANMVLCPEPLIDGNGSNWGSLTEGPAAPRYTEARLTKFAFANFFDPAYVATMDMEPNYDGRLMEPVALPSKTFHLIVNGTEGIAVGATCNIPSFSLESVNKLIAKALTSQGRVTAKDAIKVLKFQHTYGGKLADTEDNKAQLLELMENGNASILFEPEYEIGSKGRTIVVTGVPMKMRTGKVLEKIAAHAAVANVTDETSIEAGIRLVVEAKRGASWTEASAAPIIRMLSSRVKFRLGYLRETTLVDEDKVKVESELVYNGVLDALYDWVTERKAAFVKAVNWRIAKEQAKLDRTNFQLMAHENRDVLDACRDKPDPKAFLMQKLKVDSDGADYMLGLTVMQLTRINGDKIKAAIKEHNKVIAGYKAQLKDVPASLLAELGDLK